MDSVEIIVTGGVAVVSGAVGAWLNHVLSGCEQKDQRLHEAQLQASTWDKEERRATSERVRLLRERTLEETREYNQAWIRAAFEILDGRDYVLPDVSRFPLLDSTLLAEPWLIEAGGRVISLAIRAVMAGSEDVQAARLEIATIGGALDRVVQDQRERIAQGVEPLRIAPDEQQRAHQAAIRWLTEGAAAVQIRTAEAGKTYAE